MTKRDGDHSIGARREGNRGGHLQEALRPHKVGLKRRAKRVAAPGDAGDAYAGLAEERVVKGNRKGRLRRQLGEDSAADDGKHLLNRETIVTEDPIGSGPVLELATAGGQHSGDGMSSEAEEATQGEGLRAIGDALLGERWGGVAPELLEGGGHAGSCPRQSTRRFHRERTPSLERERRGS